MMQLPAERFVIFVASTTGEGEVPDNMRGFWQFLLRRDLPPGSLAALTHACYGLGDSGYPKFCYAAKRLHRRLEQLGSTSMVPLGLGDDQDALGIEQTLRPWLVQLWTRLDALIPLPFGLSVRLETECPPPRFRVGVLDASNAAPATMDISDADGEGTAAAIPTSRHRPHAAPVLQNRLLTLEGCGREVRHIELDVTGWGLCYQPGDALAVQPINPEGLTLQLIKTLNLSPSSLVSIQPDQPHAPLLRCCSRGATTSGSDTPSLTVYDLFAKHLDIFGVPRRPFFSLLAHFATDPDHKERLNEFGAPEGASDLLDYATRPRRTYAEVLTEFPSARPPLAYYLDLIPPLRERYFSISSSPLLHPNAVHLTVAVVKYQTRLQVPRFGVCSNYLAGLTSGSLVSVWLRQGCLRLPSSPSAPIVMVGPGTGVAPFRAFVQTREAQRQNGSAAAVSPDVGASCLFFGCRRPDHDYLYSDEWSAHVTSGALTHHHVAFSRQPQQPKVYVQHRMREEAISSELWALLAEPSCHVYVAGAANQMPKAVRKALKEVAIRHGGCPDEAAADEWLKKMEVAKRLQFETW